MRHTAVIADDHPIVRQGLRQILEGIGAIDIVAEASNGLETIRHTKTLRPDLLILDIAMPYSKGLEVYLEVKRWSPETKVVIFTGLTSQGLLSQIIQTDIHGLLLKRGDGSELQAAIPKVLGGQRVISTELSGMASPEPALESLTNREIQILSLIANGHNNSHIARMLNISPKTVDNHRTNIMRKLDVHSVAELMAYALREGILDAVRQL